MFVPEKVIVPPNDVAVEFEPSVTVIELLDNLLFAIEPANLSFAIEPANIAFSTEPFAIVNAPLSLAVASPDNAEKIYFFTLVKSERLFVPPPPSSTIISSASTKSAPISVPPSISRFAMGTSPAASST